MYLHPDACSSAFLRSFPLLVPPFVSLFFSSHDTELLEHFKKSPGFLPGFTSCIRKLHCFIYFLKATEESIAFPFSRKKNIAQRKMLKNDRNALKKKLWNLLNIIFVTIRLPHPFSSSIVLEFPTNLGFNKQGSVSPRRCSKALITFPSVTASRRVRLGEFTGTKFRYRSGMSQLVSKAGSAFEKDQLPAKESRQVTYTQRHFFFFKATSLV